MLFQKVLAAALLAAPAFAAPQYEAEITEPCEDDMCVVRAATSLEDLYASEGVVLQ
jgi:hypothetical protein